MAADVFVTGTDTGVGKTVVAGMLASVWRGYYWKPIQSGSVDETDRCTVERWIGADRVLPEAHVLRQPLSPHLAARLDGVNIRIEAIRPPSVPGPLIVEGAGGVLVPLNATQLMIDLMVRLDLPVVIAARSGLGTLNHTLLTVGSVRDRGCEIMGVVLVGEKNLENRRAIEHYGEVEVMGEIPPLERLDAKTFAEVYRSFSIQRPVAGQEN